MPKAQQGMVTIQLRSVFAQETAADILNRWDDLAASLAECLPNDAALLNKAREDVLAFRSTNTGNCRAVAFSPPTAYPL